MGASATNAALAYRFLGDNTGVGLATGIAVDIALCVSLIGDRRLYEHGQTSTWGRVLRITTAVMALFLNSGVAAMQGRFFLAFLHAFLPVLLVCLTEYGQDVLIKFSTLEKADQSGPTDHPADHLVHRTTPDLSNGPVSSTEITTKAQVTPPVRLVEPKAVPTAVAPTYQSDDQLLDQLRKLADQSAIKVTRNAVMREFGIGATRASRLLDRLNTIPPAGAHKNGRVVVTS